MKRENERDTRFELTSGWNKRRRCKLQVQMMIRKLCHRVEW